MAGRRGNGRCGAAEVEAALGITDADGVGIGSGVGKVGCTYTATTFGRFPSPVMLFYGLVKDSNETGRRLQLNLVGTPEVLAPYEPRSAAGFLSLAKQAAALVEDNVIGS